MLTFVDLLWVDSGGLWTKDGVIPGSVIYAYSYDDEDVGELV